MWTWKCLYEAALGLQYLRSRKVTCGDLRSENIIVGADLVTKLYSIRERSARVKNPMRDALNWRALELIRNEWLVPIMASNIFAFRVCIWEAVMLELPWKDVASNNFADHFV